MSDLRRDWRLYLLCDLGWQFHSDGTLASCRRERDARIPGTYWTDWSIRRPEQGKPTVDPEPEGMAYRVRSVHPLEVSS